MAYSYHLKQARKKLNISLRKAAGIFHLSPSTLSRYEEGLILRIPPRKLKMLIQHYGIDPSALRKEWLRENALQRLIQYEESQRIDADFLYERYSSLDERGKRNVLRLLLYESELMTHSQEQDMPRGH